MKVRYTKRAISELDEIGRFFSEVNPSAGEHVLHRIEIVTAMLCEMPQAGRSIVGLSGVRGIAVAGTNYRIYYRLRSDRLEVLSIFDTRRNPSKAPKA